MKSIDLALIQHARLAFDMALIPLYVEVAYIPCSENDCAGTIVCVDLYADGTYRDAALLADGVPLSRFPEDVQVEFERELNRHLIEQVRRGRLAAELKATLAAVMS